MGGLPHLSRAQIPFGFFYIDAEHLIRKLPIFQGDCCLLFCDQEYAHTLGEEVVREIFECS